MQADAKEGKPRFTDFGMNFPMNSDVAYHRRLLSANTGHHKSYKVPRHGAEVFKRFSVQNAPKPMQLKPGAANATINTSACGKVGHRRNMSAARSVEGMNKNRSRQRIL